VALAPPEFERKILAPADVAHWAARLARPLVFTNGVFDVLHRGHATYLARARSLGAALLVALNGDASVRRLRKGSGRPVNALEDRMALVAALESVDAVTWFDEDTPAALIAACRPEVLVKGGDWPVARIVGASEVRQAAAAFNQMRERIRRQIAQRTEMLAGVSHDLRTPLTRMKLALALLGDGADTADLKADVAEMEKMLVGYLAFARGADRGGAPRGAGERRRLAARAHRRRARGARARRRRAFDSVRAPALDHGAAAARRRRRLR